MRLSLSRISKDVSGNWVKYLKAQYSMFAIFPVCHQRTFSLFAPSWNFSFLFSEAIQFYSQYLTKNQITQNPNLSPIHLNWYHVSSLWFNSLTEIWLRKADLVDFIIYNLGSFPKSSCLFSRYLDFFVCLKP